MIKKWNIFLESYTDKELNKTNEALSPSQFRKYVSNFNKERYEDKFQEFKDKYDGDKNAYRIYLPYKEIKKSETEEKIDKLFSEHGYEIIDYTSGISKYKDAKNTSKIGKVLNSLLSKSSEKERISGLIKQFVEDPIRKSGNGEMLVCISRHPYDIAGADTDRKWSNCMTIGSTSNKEKIRDGENVKYLLKDVKEGSLIAYLINSTDKNINNPIANLNIKPYVNINNDSDYILLSDSKMYGNGNDIFKTIVDEFLNEFNGQKRGLYCLNKKLYKDYNKDTSVLKNMSLSDLIEESEKFNSELLLTIFNKIHSDMDSGEEITDYIQKNNINISKVLNSLEYKDIIKNISNIDDDYSDELYEYHWILTYIIKISRKLKNENVILNVMEYFFPKLNFDFYDDGIYQVLNDTSNEKIIDTISKFWDILEILVEDEDIKNLEKVIKIKKLKFSLLKEYDDHIIKFNDSYYYINSKIYNKLLNNKNRI